MIKPTRQQRYNAKMRAAGIEKLAVMCPLSRKPELLKLLAKWRKQALRAAKNNQLSED